ncbi:hypothetical protein [Orenia marismortui]|uniref:Uncharacterized protein n=1 Tax=Orenia marismortui TaxID=46469 RepID=A0A4R8H7K9_9FIRM|nr:hypothetical protein [Orenia marismortui]TDX51435.1 hypothetical protein C7959_11380 [Orenia marismortui]
MKRVVNYIFLLMLAVLVLNIGTVSAESLPFHGFVESSIGGRYDSPDYINDDLLLYETRAQLSYWGALGYNGEFQVKADIIKDNITDQADIKLREGYIWAYPSANFEIKAGRQVLTWGTGDLIFINDLFPKEYQSFFLGRDQEYLKAPSDAIKFSFFPQGGAIVDVVWTPSFTADNYLKGERLTFFDPGQGGNIEANLENPQFSAKLPEKDWENGELALRVKKNYQGNELAFYAYKGFYKEPNANQAGNGLEFAPLNVYGASWRNNVMGGVANLELGYYDSADDQAGDKWNIPNSSIKALLGYSRDLGNDFSVGVQYNLEHMEDYDAYISSLGANYPYLSEENNEQITLRLTKLFNKQTIRTDLFTFYSLSDKDAYLRPQFSYDWTDNINFSAGANIFLGEQDYTFFGQLEDNSNLYMRMRYSY